MQRIRKNRGIKGAASWCAFAAFLYLFCQYALQTAASFLMGLRVEGATLENPVGFSAAGVNGIRLMIGVLALMGPIVWLLKVTRLNVEDLRIARPPQWSPFFCSILFLGIANAGNVVGALITRLTGTQSAPTTLPDGGMELVLAFCTLCILPAVGEELLFRGALQGLMHPCGSVAAIFGPALLFALLHMDLAQGITALAGGIFLGWLAERTGSILPGMMLHFSNNCIAFLILYLQAYAPGMAVTGIELFVLLAFPLAAIWLLWRAVTQQGFRFSDGMHPGVDISAVFSSPAYTLAVLILLGATIWQSVVPA